MTYKDRILKMAIVSVAAFAMAAGAGNARALETSELIGQWRAVSIDDWAPPAKIRIQMSFRHRGEFSSSTGCNFIRGNYEVKEGKLVLIKTRITLKYCGKERMQVERRVSKMVHGRGLWQVTGRVLTLTSADHKTTSRFERVGAN